MVKSGPAQRVIVPVKKYHSEELSAGVIFERLYPGGKDGPNNETSMATLGGQTWTQYILLGTSDDSFQTLIPDIRLPANQLWPLHWHDTWTMVLVLEGSCAIGDWHMKSGDIFIAEPSIEYGPLLIGSQGCRMLEIFAQAHLAEGGYAPEYRDHPTLQGSAKTFVERSALNKRNDGRQMLPLGGVEGFYQSNLSSKSEWHLGNTDDPDRCMVVNTQLAPLQKLPRHRYDDWHFIMVLSGSFEIAGKTIEKDGCLIIRPMSVVEDIQAGQQGAHILELARTSRGITRKPA